MLERELLLRELDIKFFKWLMKEEFSKNRWYQFTGRQKKGHVTFNMMHDKEKTYLK